MKDELLQFDGVVTEILPDERSARRRTCSRRLYCGKDEKEPKTLAGDRVTVEMSPYDLEKGRLIFRHKDDRAGTAKRAPQRYQFRRR